MKITATIMALALVVAPAAGVAQGANFVTVQPPGQWLASQFLGKPVTNQAGETIGNVSDLLFDKSGRIATAVIGVGGFLGIGEKNVAISYGSLSITADAGGKRVISAPLSKDQLQAAPEFKPTEKTVYMRAKEQAGEMGHKAIDQARELKDKAAKQIEDMRK